ncbi:MAG: hypothetical protein NVSMB29_18920 [Candidatus Dormibacteria bacterium]
MPIHPPPVRSEAPVDQPRDAAPAGPVAPSEPRPRRRAGARVRVVRDRFLYVRELGEAPAAVARNVTSRAGRRARRELALLLPVLIAIPVLNALHSSFFREPVAQLAAAALLVAVGWTVARDLGRLAGPRVLGRVSDQTAGPLDFLVRALTLGAVVLLALHIVGVSLGTLAAGGTVGVILLGLAAQQTLGNLLAGIVLVISRPLRVGDVVRLQSGLLAGSVEGTVRSMGLWYVTLANGEDYVLVPNSAVLSGAVMPQREPDGVDLRTSLNPNVRLTEVQAALRSVSTATRSEPHIMLEEVDDDRIVVRITAVPRVGQQGAQLADEILAALLPVTPGRAATRG